MSVPDSLEPLLAPILAIQRLIEQFDDQGVLIGGVATSILGKPRLTADADALILLATDDIPHLLQKAKAEGLTPRLPDIEQFARRNRVVLLVHEASGIHVDISLGLLPFELETVERSELYQIGSLQIRLPTPEDLIILKAVAHRPKDLLDIEAIITSQKQLDRERIEFWVQQFAELLEMPELWTDVARLLERKKG